MTVTKQKVSNSFGFVKSTAIGGLVFLLPLIVIDALIVHFVPIVMPVVEWLGKVLPSTLKSFGGIAVLVLLAIVAIIFLCFLGGLLARRTFIRQFGQFIEKKLILLFPRYTIIRDQMTGTIGGDETNPHMKPVVVRFDEMSQLAFETDRTADGRVAIFLPGSPDPWAGQVVVVVPEIVERLDADFPSAVHTLEQFGRGSGQLLRKPSTDSATSHAD